jgi:hypothetical protein
METSIVKDERITLLRSRPDVDRYIADGWKLEKEQAVEVRKAGAKEGTITVIAWVMSKIVSPREFKVSETKWLVKDGVRAKYTTMDYSGKLKVDIHGYNTELMKISLKVRVPPEVEFRDMTDQEWQDLDSKLGDRLLTAVRRLNEPSEDDLRNLLLQ